MSISFLTLYLSLVFSISTKSQSIEKIPARINTSPLAELPATELVQRLVNDIGGSETMSEVNRRLHRQKWFGHFADDVSDEDRLELIAALLLTAQNAPRIDYRTTAMAYLSTANAPRVLEPFIAITTSDRDIRARHAAVRLLPDVAKNQRVLSVLVQILESLESKNSTVIQNTRFVGGVIESIGTCGEIAVDALFDIWDDEYYRELYNGHLYSAFASAWGPRDGRSLDFLLSLLREIDLKTEVKGGAVLHAIGVIGQYAQGSDTEPRRVPNRVAVSRVQSALETGLRTDNHPSVIATAATSLAYMTERGDFAILSRLRNVLPLLDPLDQEYLEDLIEVRERLETVVDPPLRVNPPLMDRVPLPPTGSQ